MGVFDRLLAFFGRRAANDTRLLASAPRPSAGSVMPTLPLSQQIVRIGGNLTPEKVSAILRAADGGFMAPLCDLANEMRQKDCTLQQCLQQRECGLSSLPWELCIPGVPDSSTKGARQKRFVQEALERGGILATLIPHLVGSVYYGYAVSEILWVEQGGKLVPSAFVNHAPRRFRFRMDDGALVWADQGMDIAGVDFVARYPDRFIVAQPRINGDVKAREGLVRLLVWIALFRNWALSDWVRLGEIAWKPWRWAEYTKDATKPDIDQLVEVLSGMVASGVAVLPETAKLHIEYPGGTGTSASAPGHGTVFETLGTEMAKAIVGQTLTTSEGKNGTQALGKVHNEVRKDIRDADALFIGQVITKYLIEPMVRLNFGANAPVPEFRFVTEDAKDLVALSQGLAQTVSTGLPVPQTYAYELLGIPAPKDGEEVIEPPQKAPPPSGDGQPPPDGETPAEDAGDTQAETPAEDAGDMAAAA